MTKTIEKTVNMLVEADKHNLTTREKKLIAYNGHIKGKRIAINRIGLHGIVSAHVAGCQSISDVADYLDVTEEFLLEALLCYRQKYELYKKLDNYIIYFEPGIVVFEITSRCDVATAAL